MYNGSARRLLGNFFNDPRIYLEIYRKLCGHEEQELECIKCHKIIEQSDTNLTSYLTELCIETTDMSIIPATPGTCDVLFWVSNTLKLSKIIQQ